MTKIRIREWIDYYGEDGVYVSFSGGKDSTVLLNLVREDYPNVKAMFVDTGLEYPEIKEFVKTFDNVDIIRPKMSFRQVIDKYGYPFISKEVSHKVGCVMKNSDSKYSKCFDGSMKGSAYNCEKWKFLLDAPFRLEHKCCDVMKKAPAHAYEKSTKRAKMTGELAEESRLRVTQWIKNGCNGFDLKSPVSKPLSFWTEQDILRYIKEYNIPICSVYGKVVIDYDSDEQLDDQMDFSDFGLYVDNRKLKTTGCSRTGCMFCGYGCHLEEKSRFQSLKITHPKIYDYIMRPKDQGGLDYKAVIDWINENGNLNIRY
jgi:3'-phosphoadenosine 5'-phosphosulfate sulfotransferase (PAPS reductase)/FAD synthetase